MKMQNKCLPCLINQVVKVVEMTQAKDKDVLFQKVFGALSKMDFNKTNPEIIGMTFRILKEHIGNEDPYKEVRNYYNKIFLEKSDLFLKRIDEKEDSLLHAIKYAIIGNIIDFNPIHTTTLEEMIKYFDLADEVSLQINHTEQMLKDIQEAKVLLYLGDNCGEICLDKLLIQKLKQLNPKLNIYFGVRGVPVVNDSIEEDAYRVGIDDYGTIISNGDDSLGTILERTSEDFKKVYKEADFIIAKGQANYESLSERLDKTIYFLLMAKCEVIAEDIGVSLKSLVCMNNKLNRI